MTASRIKAHIWLNNAAIPAEICAREPSLKDYGFYRILNSGELEFVSFCDSKAREFFAMYKTDYNKLMNEAYGKK